MFLFLFCSFPFSSLLFCLKNVFLRVQTKNRLLTMSCSKVKANVAFFRCLGVITSSAVGIFGITNCTVCFRSQTKRATAAEAGKKFCAGDGTQTACLLLGPGLATTQQQQQQEKRTKRQLQQSKSKPSSGPVCASPGHSTLAFHNIPTSATLCMRKISVIL